MKKSNTRSVDKAREMHRLYHLTRPPRLEGKSKNAMMRTVRKKKVR